MPVYEYTAISAQGRNSKGSIDAENIRAARQRLRAGGIFPTDIRESMAQATASKDIKRIFFAGRVRLKDLGLATRQLATLSGAGLPLVDALLALADQTESDALKRIIVDVKEKVEEGSSLASALAKFPKAFPKLYINMVASGETSGTLDAVLENLADYLETQIELRRKISTALFYPVLMLTLCTLVVVALFAFVVPMIVEIFQKQGAVLPLPTRIVIMISYILVHYWWAMIAVALLALYGMREYYRTPRGRSLVDRRLLRLPIIGSIYRKVLTARVAGTLGAMLSNGVGLLGALDIVRNMVGNIHVAKALEDARDGVREGRSLAKELGKAQVFPVMLSHMIAVGETSGKLESMLAKAGKAYENEVRGALAGFTALIEPLMIVGLGGVVFFIVISILMPMVNLIEVIQR